MTESKAESASQRPKELLALNPEQEAEFKKKVQEVKKKNRGPKGNRLTPGVVYVGHLPVGLFEPQLRSYFEQFGKVLRLRLSRSKKTGGSKGYAFLEFECDEVAKIVAETMNNYLMGERLIKCQVIPPEKVHEKLFVGSQKMFKRPCDPAVSRYNRKRSAEQIATMTERLLRRESRLRRKLAQHGLHYHFPGFVRSSGSDPVLVLVLVLIRYLVLAKLAQHGLHYHFPGFVRSSGSGPVLVLVRYLVLAKLAQHGLHYHFPGFVRSSGSGPVLIWFWFWSGSLPGSGLVLVRYLVLAKLAQHGLHYHFPGFAAQVPQKKQATDAVNVSSCSDTTPLCTPSFLERRKTTAGDEDEDAEIIINMPAVEEDDDCFVVENDSEEEEEEEEEDSESDEEDPQTQ
ncbi:MKI67 FHA domain-interacting nucleolar phosphoprotein isoform X2 [Fundulus heteroclitus]|uniref:MKI67 FHA domain-interacting nucleolar phosphoprotein isoform X2 n=1 Tax=Fundulus heteroclitus TaxID=8078 RepID=UPI00165AF25A|nr:MKI67 FHA domain-interacting nucleolar phosphoprotein isoform X2 [Fundulus heteroclitus]